MSDDKFKNAAKTSNADRVLEAVSEVRAEPKKPLFVCTNCEGTSFTTRKPLGGPLIRICSSCGAKSFKPAKSMAALMPENLNHGQGTGRGPTASTLDRQSPPKPDKHQPEFRSKGKGRPSD